MHKPGRKLVLGLVLALLLLGAKIAYLNFTVSPPGNPAARTVLGGLERGFKNMQLLAAHSQSGTTVSSGFGGPWAPLTLFMKTDNGSFVRLGLEKMDFTKASAVAKKFNAAPAALHAELASELSACPAPGRADKTFAGIYLVAPTRPIYLYCRPGDLCEKMEPKVIFEFSPEVLGSALRLGVVLNLGWSERLCVTAKAKAATQAARATKILKAYLTEN